MLEIVWATGDFNNKEDWPEDGSQPFVLSTGDTSGYGQHADYVFGWKADSLQRAMDGACIGASCAKLPVQAIEAATQCTIPKQVHEDVDGCASFARSLNSSLDQLTHYLGFDKLPGDGLGM